MITLGLSIAPSVSTSPEVEIEREDDARIGTGALHHMELVLGEGRGVGQGLSDVFLFEVRQIGDDLRRVRSQTLLPSQKWRLDCERR